MRSYFLRRKEKAERMPSSEEVAKQYRRVQEERKMPKTWTAKRANSMLFVKIPE